MAISTHFQTEIDAVDPTKILVFHSGEPGYGDLEWSYSGLNVYGGSDLACEQGASALLHAMGFRWYAPNPLFHYQPASIPTDLSAPQQSYFMPDLKIWLAYGHSWDDTLSASRTLLNGMYSKWAILNGCKQNTRPAGHRWDNIIGQNSAWFAANPQVLSDSNSFDLPTLQDAVDQTDYNNLVNICAAELLKQGFNEWDRTNFDPSDGDNNPSDRVFPFTKDVVDACRAGTPAIGTHPARAGNPNAELGIYAYAGHRLPPTDSVSPGVFTQVALAFNSTPYSYLELVQLHGAKADSVLLRDYLDTQVWSQSRPFVASVRNLTSGAQYVRYKDAGAIGVNSEFGANWLNNMAGTAHHLRIFKNGTNDGFATLQEMVNLIFDGDQAVYDIYVLMGNSRESFSRNNLKRLFDIVSRMQDGWYKTLFKHWCVIQYEFEYLPPQIPVASQTADDPYPAAFSRLMSHVTAVRDLDITHSYATLRQLANSRVYDNYPDLWFKQNPRPAWFSDSYLPTDYDFNKCYALLAEDVDRDADLDSTDLVIVQNIVANSGPLESPGESFSMEGRGKFVIVGPAEISVTDGGVTSYSVFDAGIHDFYYSSSSYRVGVVSGYAFLDMFGRTRYEGAYGGSSWLYVPSRCEGAVSIVSETRIVVNDGSGELDITPSTDPALIAALAPGQNKIQSSETRGFHYFVNVNRYISLRPDVMLLPRIIAEEDFGNLLKVRKVGSFNDTTPPTTPGTPVVQSTISSAVSLTWAPSTDDGGVVTYNIYRGGEFVGSSQEPAYIDTGLTPETTYTYTVRAKDRVGNLSEESGSVQGVTTAADVTEPSVPTNLAVVSTTSNTATISWDASTDAIGVAGYYIYRDTVKIATRSSPRFIDKNLAASTAYDYQVSAYDDAGNESALTAAVEATTDAPDITAPTFPTGHNLVVTLETVETIALDWDAATDDVGVAGYYVYQYNPDEEVLDYEVVASFTNSNGTIVGLESGVTYSFKVSAYDAAGNESTLSSAVEGTTT